MRIQADPDPDQTFESQKVEFLHEKYTQGRWKVKKHSYEGTKAFLKGRKPGLFVSFGQFPCSFIRIRISNTDPDPRQHNECGSGSTTLLINIQYRYFTITNAFSLYLHRSFMVSFIAFSGATPSSWGTSPRYRPVTPSCLTTWVIFIHSFKVNVQAFIHLFLKSYFPSSWQKFSSFAFQSYFQLYIFFNQNELWR